MRDMEKMREEELPETSVIIMILFGLVYFLAGLTVVIARFAFSGPHPFWEWY